MPNLKIFTDNISDEAKEEIDLLLEQEAFKKSKVRIMPDVHAGKGCVIGFTGALGNKVIPSIVGVDIGCGIFCANLGNTDIDLKKLDDFIKENIPSGMNVNKNKVADFDLTQLYCYKKLKRHQWIENSVGSLGGGNHFIEIDIATDKEKYLVIHSGSRNLGAQVANYYQDLANQICNHDLLNYQNQRDTVLKTYKELGKERDAYLHDMRLCQEFAILNRFTIAKTIADYMGFDINNYFESVHNYISFEDNIVRKGAIRAQKEERVIIPINMRDGCLLGLGKGNQDWNNSAPHGAGRVMSRAKAMQTIDLEDYKKTMQNVYTTSVTENTKDEAPFVYKSLEEIKEHIIPTVEVTKIIKPIYNFKAS